MSAKKSNEQVLARRLKPIYDLIDTGQNKKAIAEADKVLKKHPNTQTAKALKILALIRTDRIQDALPLLNALEEEIGENTEFDENTVQALNHCYKDMNTPDRMVQMFTKLTKRYPGNEKLLRELFFAQARLSDFKEQQRIAMQLYKESGGQNVYYLWAVMCVLTQGFADEKLGNSMLFPLAHKMLQKVSSDDLQQTQGFDLQLITLEALQRYGEAANLVEGQLKEQSGANSDLALKAHFHRLRKLDGNFNAIFEEGIQEALKEPNEWINWTNLAEAVTEIAINASTAEKTDLMGRLLETLNVALEKEEHRQTVAKRRGPLLGKLLLLDRLLSDGHLSKSDLTNSLWGRPLDAMKELVNINHGKPFCFLDLKQYLRLLDAGEQRELLDSIAALGDETWTRILWEQVSYFTVQLPSLSDQQLLDAVRRLISQIANKQGVNGLAATQIVQMVLQYAWELHRRRDDVNILLSLLLVLEWTNSQFTDCGAYLAIALCRIYGEFGAIQRISELNKQIQLKFIQRDSLAYLHFFVAEDFGHFNAAISYYASLTSMYTLNGREISDCIVASFRNSAFGQIPKLVDFHLACTKSLYAVGSQIMGFSLDACFGAESSEMPPNAENLTFDWEQISDNRDFSMQSMLIPVDRLDAFRRNSFEELKCYLRIRGLLCSCIGQIGRTALRDSAQKLFALLEEYRHSKFAEPPDGTVLEAYATTRLHSFLHDGGLDLPVSVVKLALAMAEEHSAVNATQPLNLPAAETALECLQAILATFSASTLPDSKNSIKKRVQLLRHAAKLIEMFALSLIGCAKLERLYCAVSPAAGVSREGKGRRAQQQKTEKTTIHPYTQRISEALTQIRGILAEQTDKEWGIENEREEWGWERMFPEQECPALSQTERRLMDSIGAALRLDELQRTVDCLIRRSSH